jgi:hypothetical protein
MNTLFKFSSKNFSAAVKARIQFLGKRSLIQEDHKHRQHVAHHITSGLTQQNTMVNKKEDIKFIPKPRIAVSSDEIETINNGGTSKLVDWNRIKLKTKLK